MLQQFVCDAPVCCFPGVSGERSLLGMRGTAGPQPRQGLAQGRREGHGQGQGCCLPSRGLSGLAPAGDTGPGEQWGRGEPPRAPRGAPSLLWPLRSPRAQLGLGGMGLDGMSPPAMPSRGQGQPHARGPPQFLAPSPPHTPL